MSRVMQESKILAQMMICQLRKRAEAVNFARTQHSMHYDGTNNPANM